MKDFREKPVLACVREETTLPPRSANPFPVDPRSAPVSPAREPGQGQGHEHGAESKEPGEGKRGRERRSSGGLLEKAVPISKSALQRHGGQWNFFAKHLLWETLVDMRLPAARANKFYHVKRFPHHSQLVHRLPRLTGFARIYYGNPKFRFSVR